MPKINVEVAETQPEPQENHVYIIGECELFTSQIHGYKGLRVPMKDEADQKEIVAALWMREVAGKQSKLGAFITVLGQDTDTWLGKKIMVKSWRPNLRKIEVLQ